LRKDLSVEYIIKPRPENEVTIEIIVLINTACFSGVVDLSSWKNRIRSSYRALYVEHMLGL
jgi:hypothetical protein